MAQDFEGPLQNCPRCGARRERTARFCPNCGLDYWRVAAGEPIGPAPRAQRRRWFWRRTSSSAGSASPPDTSTTAPATRVAPAAPAETQAATPTPAIRESETLTPVESPDGVRTIRVRAPRTPNRARDTADVVISRLRAVPTRARMIAAALAGAIVVVLLVLVVLHPFDASNGARQTGARSTPTPPGPNALVDAFFHTVRDPAAAFHVVVIGDPELTSGGSTTRGALRADLQVVGDDLSGGLDSTPADPSSRKFNGQLTRVGGRSWVRPPGALGWEARPLPVETDVLNPFAWIATADEVSFVNPETGNGEHRSFILRVDKWLNGAQYDALIATLTDVDRQGSMEVEVDEQGVPMQATYRYSLTGKGRTGASVSVSGTLQYTFDAWGKVGPIGPPS